MANKDIVVRNMAFATGTGTSGNQGAAVYVGDLDPATVVLSAGGTFSATVQFQGSIDGQVYFSLGGTLASTAGVVNMSTDGTAKMLSAAWVRVTCTAFTSNTSAVTSVAGMPKSVT